MLVQCPSLARRAALLFCLLMALAPRIALAQAHFSTTLPSLSQNTDGTLSVSLPLVNTGTGPASGVQVTQITLNHAPLLASVALPEALGDMAAGASATVQAGFDSAALVTGAKYLLTVRGTYVAGNSPYAFTVNGYVTEPGLPGKISDEQRRLVLLAVENQFNLFLDQTGKTNKARLLAFMQSRPEFEASGKAADTSVWARFIDGRLLVIPNNRDYSGTGSPSSLPRSWAGEITAPVQPQTPELNSPHFVQASLNDALALTPGAPSGPNHLNLPESNQALFIDSTGSGFINPVSDLSNLLVQAPGNYVELIGDASVDSLKQVSGVGVFYFSAHGGLGLLRASVTGNQSSSSPTYVVFTSTAADASNAQSFVATEQQYKADLDKGRLCYMEEHVNRDHTLGTVIHYGITPLFVTNYWNFSKNSLVFMDACSSASGGAASFEKACFGCHASVYAGWTDLCQDLKSAVTAVFMFDRLLGANQFVPEDPKQRPFGYSEVLNDASNRGLGLYPFFDKQNKEHFSSLVFLANPKGTSFFNSLAPSIKTMTVDEEHQELTINGLFGQDPGDQGKVSVAGTPLTVKTWNPDQIVCSGLASALAGNVVVEVRGHQSNIVQLTRWQIKFNYTDVEQGNLPGTLTDTATINANFRADIHTPRDYPGEASPLMLPDEDRDVAVAQDSYVDDQIGGTISSILSTGDMWTATIPSVSRHFTPGYLSSFFQYRDSVVADGYLYFQGIASDGLGLEFNPSKSQISTFLDATSDVPSTITSTLKDGTVAKGSAPFSRGASWFGLVLPISGNQILRGEKTQSGLYPDIYISVELSLKWDLTKPDDGTAPDASVPGGGF